MFAGFDDTFEDQGASAIVPLTHGSSSSPFSVTGVTGDSVKIEWTPYDGASNYKMRCREQGDDANVSGQSVDADGSQSGFEFTGLESGKEYLIEVFPCVDGSSFGQPWSVSAVPLNSPESILIDDITNHSASASWSHVLSG